VKYAVLYIEEGKEIGNITYSNIVLQNVHISLLLNYGTQSTLTLLNYSPDLQSTMCVCVCVCVDIGAQTKEKG
jgi:hypothetical protein